MSSANKPLRLRVAGKDDAHALAKIHQECFPSHWNDDDFIGMLGVYGTQALLAEAAEPCGMILYRYLQEDSEILTIAVRPDFRRSGIALALLKEACSRLAAQGTRKLFLEVSRNNEAAQRFYETAGFLQAGLRKDYYREADGNYTDALVMSLELA